MSARIAGDLLERIREAVEPLDTEDVRQAYRERRFPRAELVKDLDTRYRMDLFGAAWGKALPFDSLPDGTTDAHILTAMRTIVPAL